MGCTNSTQRSSTGSQQTTMHQPQAMSPQQTMLRRRAQQQQMSSPQAQSDTSSIFREAQAGLPSLPGQDQIETPPPAFHESMLDSDDEFAHLPPPPPFEQGMAAYNAELAAAAPPPPFEEGMAAYQSPPVQRPFGGLLIFDTSNDHQVSSTFKKKTTVSTGICVGISTEFMKSHLLEGKDVKDCKPEIGQMGGVTYSGKKGRNVKAHYGTGAIGTQEKYIKFTDTVSERFYNEVGTRHKKIIMEEFLTSQGLSIIEHQTFASQGAIAEKLRSDIITGHGEDVGYFVEQNWPPSDSSADDESGHTIAATAKNGVISILDPNIGLKEFAGNALDIAGTLQGDPNESNEMPNRYVLITVAPTGR